MGSKVTCGRLIGLIIVVAALGSGTATAGNTPQGLKADGLRLQAIAHAYKQTQDRPAASFYTPQALKAEGLRWQAMAAAYDAGKTPSGSSSSSSTNGFDLGPALVGAGSMLGFAMVGVALFLGARRDRVRPGQ